MINTETELPEGWDWQRLDDLLVCLETGTRPKGGAVGILDGVPSLSAEHMTINGTFDFSNLRYVPHEFYSYMNRGHIQQNDILIVKDGATTGKTCFIDESFPFSEAVINEHVFICRANPEKAYSKYLFFWLWGENAQTAIQSTFQGAAIGGINQKFVEKVFVPLPSLPEQKRIAAILTEQLSAVEKARKASEARLEITRALPAAYLRQVFESEEAKEWEIAKVDDITNLVIDGPHITPTYQSEGIPFVTVKNIVSRKINFSNLNYISQDDFNAFSKRGSAEKGDILYTKDGTLGIPCVVGTDQQFGFFVSVALIKPKNELIDSYYLAYVLESPKVLHQVEKLGAGAGLKHMVLRSIKSLEIPLPPLFIQQNIVKNIKAQTSLVQSLEDSLIEESKCISALTNSVLRQAFSGAL